MSDPFRVVRDFESELCIYTGAPFAVAVNSCTAALFLCCRWFYRLGRRDPVMLPCRTYCSVPMSVINAGGTVTFWEYEWRGAYQLSPWPVWDCARRFTSGMYVPGQFQCVSFAAAKILGIEQGGAILHDNEMADAWFRKMRFDGRSENTMPAPDTVSIIGQHCLMIPSIAAQGLLRLHHLPKHNEDMPDYPYPDLSTFAVFK